MKNPDPKEQEKQLLSEIENYLIETGQMFPVTVEKAEIFLKHNPQETLQQPEEDFTEFFNRVCINKNYGKRLAPDVTTQASGSLAARQGTEPGKETLKKMKADREAAQKNFRKQ